MSSFQVDTWSLWTLKTSKPRPKEIVGPWWIVSFNGNGVYTIEAYLMEELDPDNYWDLLEKTKTNSGLRTIVWSENRPCPWWWMPERNYALSHFDKIPLNFSENFDRHEDELKLEELNGRVLELLERVETLESEVHSIGSLEEEVNQLIGDLASLESEVSNLK